MDNVFKGRSLTVIEDFSIEERRYFFQKVRILKDAIISGDEKTMDDVKKKAKSMDIKFGARIELAHAISDLEKELDKHGIKLGNKTKTGDPLINQALDILSQLKRIASGKPKKFTKIL